MIGRPISFDELPPCFPNLQKLNYARVTLQTLQKMEHKFEKLKVIRINVFLDEAPVKKKRVTKKRRTAGKKVGQLIEFVEAFKKVAPSLTELYMFWEYEQNSTPAELKQEFKAVEEAAASMGIKLYCRDLVRIMKSHIVQDPEAEFFMSCYAHNNLPYWAYTFNEYTLLQYAIASQNVKLVRALFERKLTHLDYELSVHNERNIIGPTPPCPSSGGHLQFVITLLIPYSNTPNCLEIVDILRENGYDVSKVIQVLEQNMQPPTPLWARMKFNAPTVLRLFENYTLPIKWFDKTKGGKTIAHKIASIRGTTVYIDLMEKQLTKEQICELMTVQDDKGNIPAHFLGEGSLVIIDRLIPYLKHCWNMKNNKNLTPLGTYLNRWEENRITLKEEKLRRFIGEASVIENDDMYQLLRVCEPEDLLPILPLLVEKRVNLLAKGEDGIGLFCSPFNIELLKEFKRLGVDLTITDDNGSNLMHAILLEIRRTASIPQLIEFLVKEGVNINQVNKTGVTPLMKAIQIISGNRVDVIKVMLENGADPNVHGPDVPSPLITILGTPLTWEFTIPIKIKIVKMFLRHGAKPVSMTVSGQRYSPVVIAITNGSAKLVKMLIDHGADTNERDDLGYSLIHFVRESPILDLPNEKIFKLIDLLLNYVNIDDQNMFGETALHHLVKYPEFVEYLIKKGANINIANCKGSTPLLIAVDSVDLFLKSSKLDWLAINCYGKTALHVLVQSYEDRLKPFMEKFNVMPVEQQNAIKKVFSMNDGIYFTPLHQAVLSLEFESVKICVEVFGLSPAMKNENLLFSEDLTRITGPSRIAKTKLISTYLLEHGAKINAQDLEGNTALHYALKTQDPSFEYIKFLLDNGADATIKNEVGLSAVDLMPNIEEIRSGGRTSFETDVPISAQKTKKEQAKKDEKNEPRYDDDEIEDAFNSDEMMDETELQRRYDFEEDLDEMVVQYDDENDGNDDNQDSNDEDESAELPRKIPGGLVCHDQI